MGVEKEKIEKSYKLKVWRRFKIQNFSTYKEGRLKALVAGPLRKELFRFAASLTPLSDALSTIKPC